MDMNIRYVRGNEPDITKNECLVYQQSSIANVSSVSPSSERIKESWVVFIF